MKLPFYRKVCKIVVLTMLMSVGYSALMHAGINTPSTGSVVNPFGSTISPLSAKYDGTNLYIAANDGTGTEMCYWFKKCMKNNLFTFFKVGQRTVNRISSDTEGISKSTGITWLNSTSSDNIGPVQIDGYGDFVGGNHMWRDADENGNPGAATYTDTLGKKYVLYTDICTAICDSVKVSIDGSEMPVGTVVYGQHVEVKVWNTLFDPLVVPNEGDEVLTSPLIGEFVTYTVTGGSIAVDVRHDYKKSVTVRTYYGMQSMFVKEDSIMTPGGKHATFTVESAATKFNKNDYPATLSIMLMAGVSRHGCAP